MIRLSMAARNRQIDALAQMMDGGRLVFYDGARPILVSDRLDDQKELARFDFGRPAFNPAVNGEAAECDGHKELLIGATGEARWGRAFDASGKVVLDMLVRAADAPDAEDGALIIERTDFHRGAFIKLETPIRFRF